VVMEEQQIRMGILLPLVMEVEVEVLEIFQVGLLMVALVQMALSFSHGKAGPVGHRMVVLV